MRECRKLLYLNMFLVVVSLVPLTGSVSDSPQKDEKDFLMAESGKNSTSPGNTITVTPSVTSSAPENCTDNSKKSSHDCSVHDLPCDKLSKECLQCDFNCTCAYGQEVSVTCRPKPGIFCGENKEFTVQMLCRYCYQTAPWEHTCTGTEECSAINSPREMFISNCTVKSDVLCLGDRIFPKKLPCNWTSGYRWSTALLLSITFGGFGADRFYLGHWQEGIGKLFSFGGLGVWTIMDVILIAIRYLGPADGSLYI
ncbi:TM2 domain-containing protein almondex-like [Penaeus japonicus]|uniref:TM2 domain-containing protein almondex-like n=1 Tax=Penaeus japonicus TaxID=27405 RepID=UPI001C713559|nr:TM2 domain-containing protein almondex-like [Penaeus japonicus]